MTKEQFEIFKDKQNELYTKYENSNDPKAYDKMNEEWLEFIKNFRKRCFMNKNEPRYPKTVQNTIVAFGVCPTCGGRIVEFRDCICGQKIMWKLKDKGCEYITEEQSDKQKILDFIDEIENEHPYKVYGHGETYSQYNEAWSDALDRVRSFIENM